MSALMAMKNVLIKLFILQTKTSYKFFKGPQIIFELSSQIF